MKIRPCACNGPTCHYCAGGEHCGHCNPGNPATDEQIAARWDMSVSELRAKRAALLGVLLSVGEVA